MGCVCSKSSKGRNPHEVYAVSKKKTNSKEQEESEPQEEPSNRSPDQPSIKSPLVYTLAEPSPLRLDFFNLAFSMQLENTGHSTLSDWQTLLKDECNFNHFSIYMATSSAYTENSALQSALDRKIKVDLAAKILSLAPRNWVREILHLTKKSRQPGNERAAISLYRNLKQVSQHFRWLAWAVACYFYISLGTESQYIGPAFTELSEVRVPLPKKMKQWLQGFTFCNAQFQLVYRESEQGWAFHAERKTLKLFSLAVEQGAKDCTITVPMLAYTCIGPFVLVAMPLYSSLAPSESLSIEFLGNAQFRVPSSNLHRLSVDGHKQSGNKSSNDYLITNSHKLIQSQQPLRFLCVFADEEIKILDYLPEKISESTLAKLISPDSTHLSQIEQFPCQKYGWEGIVFSDSGGSGKNRYSSLFQLKNKGTFVVSLVMREPSYRRFPIFHLDETQAIGAKMQGVKTCLIELEKSETIVNHNAFRELVHRKGLNLRHAWLLCAKTKSSRAKYLIETDILARAVRKVVWTLCKTHEIRQLDQIRTLLVETVNSVIHRADFPAIYDTDLNFLLFLNRLKVLKDARVYRKKYEESLSRVIDPMKKKLSSYEYLLSDTILQSVYDSATKVPSLFLDALQLYCGLSLKEDTLTAARADNYFFTHRDPPTVPADYESFAISVKGVISFREEAYLTYLKYLEQTGAAKGNDILGESIADWVSDVHVEPTHKQEEQVEMVLPCDLYSATKGTMFRDHYDIPSPTILEEWASTIDAMTRDLMTLDGEETILIEILVFLIGEYYCVDTTRCEDLVTAIQGIINKAIYVPPELVIAYYLWSALTQERNDLVIAEQHYVSALLFMNKLVGDPRGRGNNGVPWQMVAAWKIGVLAKEENRPLDAQAADEHFDAVFMGTNQFQQALARIIKGKQLNMINPFEQWSVCSAESLGQNSLFPGTLFHWMMNHSLPMHQTQQLWSNLHVKVFYRNTLVHQISTQHSFVMSSGLSTPTSAKGTRRGMQQSSLSQVLLPENGAVTLQTQRGALYTWGTDTIGQLGLGLADALNPTVLTYPRLMTCLKNLVIKEVAVGAEHCIAVTLQGECYVWGNNDASQLGLGPDMPKVVKFPIKLNSTSHIVKAACGYQHSLLLSNEGKILSMGIGDGGVLGHGNTHLVMHPKLIQSLKSFRITDIKAGGYHNLALSDKHKVLVWGRGEGGQLGLGTDELINTMTRLNIHSCDPYIHTPVLIQELMNAVQIDCGEAHSLVLNNQHEVYGWGWGSNGQLGSGIQNDCSDSRDNIGCIQYSPIKIDIPGQVKKIAAGGLFSMFITSQLEVFACGMNDFGQLGLENPDKSNYDISVPTKLDCFSGYPIQKVYCGENHTLAVSGDTEDMTWAWGKSLEGQLGLGDVSHSITPRPVQALNGAPVHKIACGRVHTTAVIGNPEVEYLELFDTPRRLKWETTYQKLS